MIISRIVTVTAMIAWWWLLQQALQFYRLRVSTMIVLIGLSIVWVLSIISFPYRYELLLNQSWNNPLTLYSASSYIIYSLIVSVVLGIILLYRGGTQLLSHQSLLIITIALMTIWLPWIGNFGIYYILLAASIEEFVKYYLGAGAFRVYGITWSDLILFAMMSGLGFACIENIAYLYGSSSHTVAINTTMRWLIGPIVHMIFSGWLAYGYRFLRNRGRWIRGLLISSIAAILVHTWYNAVSSLGSWRIVMWVIFGGYACISRLLYQCDRLYFEAKNNLKITT